MDTQAASDAVPKDRSIVRAVGGAVIGAVAAAAWWVGIGGVNAAGSTWIPYYVFMFSGAVVTGLLVATFTVLASNTRGGAVSGIAAGGALLGLLNAAILLDAPPPLRLLLDLFLRAPVVVPYIGRVISAPMLLGFGALAAGVAVVAASLDWPAAQWLLGTSGAIKRRIASPSGAASKTAEPDAPARAPQRVAQQPAAPQPAAMARETPATERSATSMQAPVLRPASPDAMQVEPPAGTAWLTEHKRLATWIGSGVTVLLVAVIAFSVGRSGRDAEPTPTEPTPEQPAVVVPEPEPNPVPAPEPPSSAEAMPEETVDALYRYAGDGDFEGAKSTFTMGFALEPGVFDSWGDCDWEITTVIGGMPRIGECLVEVHESGGGYPGTDTITWMLREEDSTWAIHGWFMGTANEAARVLKESQPPSP